ncbi:MAG: ATP-dependent DNA helicase RecG [Oscillospiraceae bacterium]
MDIQYLKGVGEKSAQRFAKLGIFTTEDLLRHYPRDYIDYTAPYPVSSAPYDVKCAVKATVYEKSGMVRVHSGKKMFKVAAGDETAMLTITWFNNPYAADALIIGEEYLFFGKIGGGMAAREMISPVVLSAKRAEAQPLVPIYPQTDGLNSAYIAKCVQKAFGGTASVDETLPLEIISKYKLYPLYKAMQSIHFPKDRHDAENARRRLIFEELLTLQLGLLQLRGRSNILTGARMNAVSLDAFWQGLPFAPTNAQKKSAAEICADFVKPCPMNRLLQGDVGSGKTLVAAAGIYAAAQNGFQSALMVPTEILAQQHAESLSKLLIPFGINVVLLTGSIKGAARKSVCAQIKSGEAQLIVCTHAVLTDKIVFANLGFAITDEQHRFGVRQRSLLAAKGEHPHLLVMSATPIPRTLGLLMFGDLDISILDELPPGRKPVKTYALTTKKRLDMYGFIDKHIANGEQVYVVCPVIDESESDMQDVISYYEDVALPLLPKRRVGLMHGRLKAADKAAVMQSFKDGYLDVLVSTTVIEVGVDVPNASIIVIENAERYGLSSLHQLRGRVGRGSGEAFCFLVSDHGAPAVRERLGFLCRNTDGFAIAKYDLDTRGPGDFFGDRQHGLPQLKIADLAADSRVLSAAQHEAVAIFAQDAALEHNKPLKNEVERLFSRQTSTN